MIIILCNLISLCRRLNISEALCQLYECWCPGSFCRQSISDHGTFIIYEKSVFVFYGKSFKQPASFHCQQIQNISTFLCFPKTLRHWNVHSPSLCWNFTRNTLHENTCKMHSICTSSELRKFSKYMYVTSTISTGLLWVKWGVIEIVCLLVTSQLYVWRLPLHLPFQNNN